MSDYLYISYYYFIVYVIEMPKIKYDWEKIRMEFILSEFDDVEWFFKDRFKTSTNWTIRKYTTWWCKEKQKYKQKMYEDVLKKKWKETAKEISNNVERLEMLNDKFIEWMEKEMEEQEKQPSKWEKKRRLFSNDIMNMWKISRTERWLPTNISKTENTNKEEKSELTDEEVEALKIILKKNK